MKLTLSYGTKIRSGCSEMNTMFRQTGECFASAVRFLLDICEKEWDSIHGMAPAIAVTYLEPLMHRTKNRRNVKYDFDGAFPNFPSYLRRGAIASAFGKVKSFHSNLAAWEENGRSGRAPSFPSVSQEPVSLYYSNMFLFTDEEGNVLPPGQVSRYARVKVFCSQRQLTQDRKLSPEEKEKISKGKIDSSKFVWDWMDVTLKTSDVNYLAKRTKADAHISAPVLTGKGNRYELRFAVTKKQDLSDTPVFEQKILAVDLGINTAATCCVMKADGTILARRFSSFGRDTGCLYHRAALVSRAQSYGSVKTPVLWRMTDNANRKLSDETAGFILSVAAEYKVDVIVFEHLEPNGKKRGSKKRRLHLWRAKYVQELVTNRAHALGIRISRVCAWGTSRLAYDGSGKVERGTNGNYSICRFQTGKIYNCDLSASYNIGARYFIREVLKTVTATQRSRLTAKVPESEKRSTCTLSTLIRLYAELAPSGVRCPACAASAAAA